MKNRKIIILGLVTAAVILAAALVLANRDARKKTALEPALLFPALSADIGNTAEIDIASHDKSLAISIQKDHWTVPVSEGRDAPGYPADMKKVRATLLAMVQMKKLEPKTTNPDLYHRLNLRDITDKNSKARKITLKTADGTVLATLLAGKIKQASGELGSGTGQSYVRLPGTASSWLVSGAPEASTDPLDWIARDLVELDRGRVQSVSVNVPDGPGVKIGRDSPAQSDFTLLNLPKDAKLKSDSAPGMLASALGYMSFEAVKPAAGVNWSKATIVTYKTFDGLTVKMDIVGKWARFYAEYDPEAAGRLKGGTNVSGVPKDGAKEAAGLNARLGGWAYRLPEYKIKDLTPGLADMIEDVESKKSPPKGK